MKILLAQKVPYVPAFSGAAKVARVLSECLAQKNNECRIVTLADGESKPHVIDEPPYTDTRENLKRWDSSSGVEVFQLNDVEVHRVRRDRRIESYFEEQIVNFAPDWIMISEDPTYLLLGAAVELNPRRTLFLSQSQATLPFGPESFAPDGMKTDLLRQAAGICCISQYLQLYVRRWGGLDSTFLPLPLYGKGPFPKLGAFDNRYVTMINPSAVKGITIFLQLAERFPNVPFAAVPTWATSASDRARMEKSPNIDVLQATEDIDRIFAQTRVLLVPSLWGEALGLVVVEAMLRGIPVLASNVGGLPEAKLGIDYVLPVRPIEGYQQHRDDRLLPLPIVPNQDITPWADALTMLLTTKAEYDRLSAISRAAARKHVSGRSIEYLERYLEGIPLSEKDSGEHNSETQCDIFDYAVTKLSSTKLELLVRHLVRG